MMEWDASQKDLEALKTMRCGEGVLEGYPWYTYLPDQLQASHWRVHLPSPNSRRHHSCLLPFWRTCFRYAYLDCANSSLKHSRRLHTRRTCNTKHDSHRVSPMKTKDMDITAIASPALGSGVIILSCVRGLESFSHVPFSCRLPRSLIFADTCIAEDLIRIAQSVTSTE